MIIYTAKGTTQQPVRVLYFIGRFFPAFSIYFFFAVTLKRSNICHITADLIPKKYIGSTRKKRRGKNEFIFWVNPNSMPVGSRSVSFFSVLFER